MAVDRQLFRDILSFDSTTGSEGELADFLEKTLAAQSVHGWDVPEGGRNLLFSWGVPRVVFCTHMDTVPPYIPPVFEAEGELPKGETPSDLVFGRGACDAKGQIVAMYAACRALADEGLDGFGLLLLSGEETGSWGAKAFSKTAFKAPYLIVGEPTEGKMVSACKGTKAFSLHFKGEPFHSGYPQFGRSAVDAFIDFVNDLRKSDFGEDPELGPTTWNIGHLSSDNPQNVLSPSLDCRLYFRTTFVSDGVVAAEVRRLASVHGASVEEIGGDTPSRWFVIPGFESAPASFGSDAPHLSGFEHRCICGPGSIRFAHRDDEQVSLAELDRAAERYVAMFKALQK